MVWCGVVWCGEGKGKQWGSHAGVAEKVRESDAAERSEVVPPHGLFAHTIRVERRRRGGAGGIRRGLGVTSATAEIIITKRNKVVMKSQ